MNGLFSKVSLLKNQLGDKTMQCNNIQDENNIIGSWLCRSFWLGVFFDSDIETSHSFNAICDYSLNELDKSEGEKQVQLL